ncbi:hypothetical protein DEN86_01120 [Escherichia coli]|nr:hypothetical protein AW065_02205 [Escherichia coli]OTC22151.1 hypothetical protein AW073_13160 [Escherichia coli]OTE59521.1 hypothetical protein AW118_11460 [Escherichia coli]PDV44634.1 hypothetical protein BER14_13115 [Escherichia coli]TFY50019.1 hypothetical protein DEN86_01120 [Escherichia coli]
MVANLEQEDNVSLAGECPPRILTKIKLSGDVFLCLRHQRVPAVHSTPGLKFHNVEALSVRKWLPG